MSIRVVGDPVGLYHGLHIFIREQGDKGVDLFIGQRIQNAAVISRLLMQNTFLSVSVYMIRHPPKSIKYYLLSPRRFPVFIKTHRPGKSNVIKIMM